MNDTNIHDIICSPVFSGGTIFLKENKMKTHKLTVIIAAVKAAKAQQKNYEVPKECFDSISKNEIEKPGR